MSDDDIDNMDFDPADFEPSKAVASSSGGTGGPSELGGDRKAGFIRSEEDMERFKNWVCMYPVYFDKNKSHSEGRRVNLEHAVENPLAQSIVEACSEIGIRSIYEATKTHPKDWSNPGRIRLDVKNDERFKNKRLLYQVIGSYLQDHPVSKETPKKSPIYTQMVNGLGLDPTKVETVPLAVPVGWKMNSVLPVNSKAISAGEQSEDVMKELQQNMFPGLNAPELKPKKIKVRQR